MGDFTAHDASERFRAPPDRWIDVRGAAVAHRRVGSGPDVLFVHGWPLHGATFRALLPFLVDHVTCHVIDLPGTGSSRFDATSPLSIDHHVESVRRVIDALGLERVALVGHDSGGLIARHAGVDDERVVAFGLIDTEPPLPMPWRFRSFLASTRLPGFGPALRLLTSRPRLRRSRLVLGDAFADRRHLDEEFDDLFLRPLRDSPERMRANVRLARSFDRRLIDELDEIHARIDVPVRLVWGVEDRFFPIDRARAMVHTFADARLVEIPNAGLCAHEEAPEAVAAALLPILT